MKAAPSAKNRNLLWGLLLLAATFLAYRPAWNGQPLWDDAAHMTKPALRSAAGLANIWTQLGATQQYYPLTHSVFWLEYQLWGESTLGPHLFNVLLHALSALLLVSLLRRLAIRGAWLAGGMFALHPVMVESVAWITELKNVLSGAFFLAAAWAYLEFDATRRAKNYAIALLFFLLGLLSKSVVATLPAALIVIFWWLRGRVPWRRDVLPLLPLFVIGAISGLFTAWVERTFIGAHGGEFAFSFVERCLIAGRALWFYFYKLLWPAELVFIYPRWQIDSSAAWQYLFPAAFLGVAGLFWVLRKHTRGPMAVLLYFVVMLFPALGFLNVYPFRYSFVADHFQYLASIGPLAAVASCVVRGADRLGRRLRLRRPLQPLVAGVLVSGLFLLSANQSRAYSDAETLYRVTIAKNDKCWMAHTHLGLLLMETGREQQAMTHLLKALEMHPNRADAHNNLGLLLARMGRSGEAVQHLAKALELDPHQADAHNNLGFLLANNDRLDEAMEHYEEALRLHPDHSEVHYNLGNLLAKMGRVEEAMRRYERALELHPTYAEAHSNLGLLLAKIGQSGRAVMHFQKALEVNPNQANAHNNLGVMLAQMGRGDEAITHYRRALEIDPLEMEHLENLVSALVKRGRWAEARTALEDALALANSTGDEARTRAITQALADVQEAASRVGGPAAGAAAGGSGE